MEKYASIGSSGVEYSQPKKVIRYNRTPSIRD